jgi:hypothetical protein
LHQHQVSTLSSANCVQAYLTTHFTERVYSAEAVNPLSSRTFGTWTFLSSVIRLYAAYNISDPLIYQLALWTYVIALAHFASEWLVFGTAKMGKGLVGPLCVASGSLIWMLLKWEVYMDNGWVLETVKDSI